MPRLQLVRRLVSSTVARGDPGASRHASLLGPGRTTLFLLPVRHEAAQPYLEDSAMNYLQATDESLEQDINLELFLDQFDIDAFEQQLIEEHGNLEAAYLDLSDRPD